MAWLNLAVSVGGKVDDRAKSLLDALLKAQQERESMRLSAQRALRELGDSLEADDDGTRRRQLSLRDEPIGTRPRRRQGVAVAGVSFVPDAATFRYILSARNGATYDYDTGYVSVFDDSLPQGTTQQLVDSSALNDGSPPCGVPLGNSFSPAYIYRESFTTGANWQTAGVTLWLTLPLGADRCALVHVWWNFQYYYSFSWKGTFTNVAVTYESGELSNIWDQIITETAEDTGSSVIGPSYGFGADVFVVTSDEVRPVATPPGIAALLNVWYPAPVITSSESSTTAFVGGGSACDYEGNNPVVYTPVSVGAFTSYSITYPSGPSGFAPFLGLLSSFGADRIEPPAFTVQSSGAVPAASPAIYTSIQQFGGSFPGSEINVYRDVYADCREFLGVFGNPPPSTLLSIRRSFEQTGEAANDGVFRYSFFQTETQPVNRGNIVAADQFEPYDLDTVEVPTRSAANSSIDYYFAWDWEDPEYCRQKALELGFAPEDL